VLESAIEAATVRQAKRKGWRAVKMVGGGFGGNANGYPDRLFWKGPPFIVRWIEFKRPGGVLSAQQRRRIRELRDAGSVVAVCYSADSALAFLAAAEGGNWYDAGWDL